MDRTQEFLDHSSKLVMNGVRPLPNVPSKGQKRTYTQEAKLFASKARDISKKIQLASKRLERLTSLVRRQTGVFNDPSTEINQLAARIKGDTKFLKLELDDLQLYLEHHKRLVGSGSTAAADHSQSVVETMQYQLVNTATNFKEVLEKRQTNVKAQRDRRNLFGRNHEHNTLGRPFSVKHRAPSRVDKEETDGLPRPNGVKAPATPERNIMTIDLNTPEPEPAYHEINIESQEPEFMIQSSQALLQDNSYLNSRVEAVTNIESHISELGQIFNRFSEMVQRSQFDVDRIDDNINTAHDSFLAGHDELIRYWQSTQGNFWLFAKITMLLLFFVTVFVMFVL